MQYILNRNIIFIYFNSDDVFDTKISINECAVIASNLLTIFGDHHINDMQWYL